MSSSFLWPINTPPPPSSGTYGTATPPTRTVDAVKASIAFRGLLRPFRRDGVSSFANGTGAARIRSMIGQILGTRATSSAGSGELPWRPEFGSWLYLIRHRNATPVTKELARTYVEDSLRRWLPSIQVTGVDAFDEDQSGIPNTILIRVYYRIRTRAGTIVEDFTDVSMPARAA